ncbi:MAG: hypothetical protein R6U35_05560 [Candidatus Humimicrobiaceae bacterium]
MDGLLKDGIIDWLLSGDNPSVKYFTFKNLLGKPSCREAREAKSNIMEFGPVPKILEKQNEGGYWGRPEDFYVRSKYKGTVWQIIILAQLGADKNDKRIRDACNFILDYSYIRGTGGFSYKGSKETGGEKEGLLPCLTGNMVWCLTKFGYLKDPRVQKSINFIAKFQRFDDGIANPPAGWPYDRYEGCWGRHSCHMGIVKSLKGLAEIQEKERSKDVWVAIGKAAEYLLRHRIYKRSKNLDRVSKPVWLKFGFPLMWNTDVLEILEILTSLGYKDKRMEDAINLFMSKKDSTGRWKLEDTYNGRFLVNIEKKGRPSRWITMKTLKVLKNFAG